MIIVEHQLGETQLQKQQWMKRMRKAFGQTLSEIYDMSEDTTDYWIVDGHLEKTLSIAFLTNGYDGKEIRRLKRHLKKNGVTVIEEKHYNSRYHRQPTMNVFHCRLV